MYSISKVKYIIKSFAVINGTYYMRKCSTSDAETLGKTEKLSEGQLTYCFPDDNHEKINYY